MVVVEMLFYSAVPVKLQVSLAYVPAFVWVVLLTSTVPTVAPVSLFTPVIEVTVAVCGLPPDPTGDGPTTTVALALLPTPIITAPPLLLSAPLPVHLPAAPP